MTGHHKSRTDAGWSDHKAGVFRWRDRAITHRIISRLYVLGAISDSGWTTNGFYKSEHGWRLTFVHFRGKRPYVLGLERQAWGYPFHWLRYRHWPEMVWGYCGKCAPWLCCGATGYDHAEGCEDDPENASLAVGRKPETDA